MHNFVPLRTNGRTTEILIQMSYRHIISCCGRWIAIINIEGGRTVGGQIANPDCNLVNANGCPKDSDNDGLNDCEDDCPRDRGSAANDGCPEGERDRDSDGVSDDDDACFNPDCNIVDTQGCPKDTDGDGLDD